MDKKSHNIKHILKIHKDASERGELNEEASCALLMRLLRGKAFQTASNLTKSGSNVGRLYKYLQRTYKDEPDPHDASRLLTDLMERPGDLELDLILQKVLEFSYNIHRYEPKTMMEASVTATATSHAMQYLHKNYPRTVVERIRGLHINWCSRTKANATTDAYYELMDIAVKNLAGYRPNHLGWPWQQQAPQQPRNYGNGAAAPAPVQNVDSEAPVEPGPDQPADAIETLDDLTWEDNAFRAEVNNQMEAGRKPFSKNPADYRFNTRCMLCRGNSKTHCPPFWSHCNIYPGCKPQPVACLVCRGKHPILPAGAKCKSPAYTPMPAGGQPLPAPQIFN